ncbi:MAG TPA: PepSY-like domain-containing protein [Chitinophagaceae bacterium]|nr:PepSY-like domain-containing protein [Chitinophagaceae bacterium]
MKKTILFLLLIAFGATASFAQLRKVPAEVTDAFKAKYPGAEKVEWKDKITFFEAQFTMDGSEMTADFSNEGKWKESQKKIEFEALPTAVKDGFKKSKFADWTPGSVTYIMKDDKDPEYKIYVEKSSLVQKKFLFFAVDGQLNREAPGI